VEYRVLARKCRPQVFEDVQGQGHVIRTLQNAITGGRIAHAFLFSGPRGVGKTSVARILAKAVNCDKGPAPIPCNQCVHCLEITNGSAIDVREIDGASNRGIDEIRELRENVKFAPVSCRFTVYIIDEVHMLTREAFNALLKTLEEPPGHVIFIFATTETPKVPATILSRCQRFDFRRISVNQIVENLRQIAADEKIRIGDSGLTWIAEAGDGSLRDAQSILDQVISYAGSEIEDRAVEEILGRTDRRFLFLLSEAVLSRDAGRCLEIIDEAYNAGIDMRYFYQTLLGHFRNLLFTGIAGEKDALRDLSAEERARLKAQAANQPIEILQRYLEILMADEEGVRRSMNPRLNLEAVVCRLAYLPPLIPIEALLDRMERLEKRLSGAGGPGAQGGLEAGAGVKAGAKRTPAGPGAGRDDGALPAGDRNAASAAPAEEARAPYRTRRTAKPANGDPSGSGGGDKGSASANGDWQGYKDFVKLQDPALCAKIETGRCLCCGGERLTIGFDKGYLFLDDVLKRRKDLGEYGRLFFRRDTVVEIETLTSDTEGQSPGRNGNQRAAKNHRIQEIRREALSHPLVQKILDVFSGAEVRDVRVIERPAGTTADAQDRNPQPVDDAEGPGPEE